MTANEFEIGVIGAGAMGSGIAQVAAGAGHQVTLADAMAGATERARKRIWSGLEGLIEKGKMERRSADALIGRITFVPEALGDDLSAFSSCGLVIEAIVEDLRAKQALVAKLESVLDNSRLIATNTSSLSVTALGGGARNGGHVFGLHFFNPAPVMPLVEIVPWQGTEPGVIEGMQQLMRSWGKTPVVCSDTPGFIVNRIARPFYSEALRIADEGIADYATIDAAMRDLGKFRMGPFELMDFIGNDVNFAVTKSVYEAFFQEPRYRPSLTQQRLVEAGFLGRKTGRGYYRYENGRVIPGDRVIRSEAKDPFVGEAKDPRADEKASTSTAVFERILAMLINEAVDAVYMKVASPQDIDLAMTKGVNYPKGLLAWCDEIGAERVLGWMTQLQADYLEDRYRPSPLLRRMAERGTKFFA